MIDKHPSNQVDNEEINLNRIGIATYVTTNI